MLYILNRASMPSGHIMSSDNVLFHQCAVIAAAGVHATPYMAVMGGGAECDDVRGMMS